MFWTSVTYDIAFLLARHTTGSQVRDLTEEAGLSADLDPLLARPPEGPLLFFARAMAEEERDAATLDRLHEWGASPVS